MILSISDSSRRRSKAGNTPQMLNNHVQRGSEEATEDYLETINSLITEKGFAASVDIAERMKVSKPTVTSIVKKLHNQGYLVHEKYRGVTLTGKGKKLAEEMGRKHRLVTSFLTLFGVEETVAREDAERIEHGLHEETMEKLESFTEYVIAHPELIEVYLRATNDKKSSVGTKLDY